MLGVGGAGMGLLPPQADVGVRVREGRTPTGEERETLLRG